MRSPNRRRVTAIAALHALSVVSVGVLFTAGCGGGAAAEGPVSARQLFFQPAGAPGPDPFTASTTVDTSTAAPSPRESGTPGTGKAVGATRAAPGTGGTAPAGAGRARTLPGITPGVYGGTQGLSSCDVERQVRLLTQHRSRTAAFAKGARADPADVPGFLRGLTPVVLRADTRVTAHGYRNGAPTAYQAVLQTGTAVLADSRGLPRVGCSCGDPLGPAIAMEGAVTRRGTRWHGFRADHTLLISPAAHPVGELTLVNSSDNTWMQRATGTDGDEDGVPASLPPYGPDADLFDPQRVAPPDPGRPQAPSDMPSGSPEPTGSAPEPSGPAQPPAPTDGPTGGPDAPLPSGEQAGPAGRGPAPDPSGTPGALPGTPDGDAYPPVPDSDILIGPVPAQG